MVAGGADGSESDAVLDWSMALARRKALPGVLVAGYCAWNALHCPQRRKATDGTPLSPATGEMDSSATGAKCCHIGHHHQSDMKTT